MCIVKSFFFWISTTKALGFKLGTLVRLGRSGSFSDQLLQPKRFDGHTWQSLSETVARERFQLAMGPQHISSRPKMMCILWRFVFWKTSWFAGAAFSVEVRPFAKVSSGREQFQSARPRSHDTEFGIEDYVWKSSCVGECLSKDSFFSVSEPYAPRATVICLQRCRRRRFWAAVVFGLNQNTLKH